MNPLSLQAGVHLFVEKPISLKSEEEITRLAEELERLQHEHDLVIAVGYMLRYSPAIRVCLLFWIFLAHRLRYVKTACGRASHLPGKYRKIWLMMHGSNAA